MTATQYLERLLEPVSQAFTAEFAEAIVNLRVDGETQRHVEELRKKAQEDSLSEAEHRDYEAFVEAVDVLGIIQSKARRFLTA